MKQAKAIAYLRQLCCSGLSKEVVIPEFLRAVQAVIPSGSNVYSAFDGQKGPNYFLMESNMPELPNLQEQVLIVFDFFTTEITTRFINWLMTHGTLSDTKLLHRGFYSTDLYNLVYRPANQHHGLWSIVTVQGRPAGIVNLFRPRDHVPFNSKEKTLMMSLLPYVSHALQAPEDSGIQYCDQGGSGLMVMTTQGEIELISYEAKNLLALACHPTLTVNGQSEEAAMLAKLAQLCRNLDAIFQGKHAEPPSWSHTNSRGRFIFRAYWLTRSQKESGGLIGMTIEHQEPLTLKILRTLETLPLSPAQKQVALLITQGLTNEKIAEHLHIKLSTVKDHIGKIFTKLELHQREELLPKLLALEKIETIELF